MTPDTDPLGDPRDRARRFGQFHRLFTCSGYLGDLINQVLDNHGDAIRLKPGPERLVSLIFITSFGKAMKTFQAIQRMRLLGYGEDALILLRTNVNLLINTAYIVTAQNPDEHSKDFIASSYRRRAQFLRIAYGEQPTWQMPFPPDELTARAQRWEQVGIADRARTAPIFHYDHGYRFYSSFEHSDAFALDRYLDTHRNPTGLHIEAGETDSLVDIALIHSFGVMADFLSLLLQFFSIDRPDIRSQVRETWASLVPDSPEMRIRTD